jgi:plasmid stability protein
MRTLYLRNVPDEVVERLEKRAKAESTSVNTVAVRELTEVSKRFDNAAIFASLPKLEHDISMEEIVADIRELRGE